MKCEDVILELDAFLSGELDRAAARQIETHVAECPVCAVELKTLRKENSLYDSFLSTIEVPPGDWKMTARPGFFAEPAGQEDATQRPQAPIRLRPGKRLAWAVAASLIVTTGVAVYFYQSRRAVEPDHQANGSPSIIEEYNMDDTVSGLNQAVVALGLAYDQKKEELDPTIVSELDRNIGVIDKAIAECQQALKNDPRNDQAAEFLVVAYEKKIDLLKQITED
jgi:hypothetical protein